MANETERKFLVKGEFKHLASSVTNIKQGYLCSLPERTVRVRINNNEGFLTIKGIGNESGISRYEWESKIPIEDAKALLELCEPGKIEKNRYLVKYGRHTFEVDEFLGSNQGLVVAEIELESEDEYFEKPEWLGKEVSGKKAYYNSSLIKKPFTEW